MNIHRSILITVIILLASCKSDIENYTHVSEDVSRGKFISGCAESGEFSNQKCQCIYKELRENYSVKELIDPKMIDGTHAKIDKFIDDSNLALEVCTKNFKH